MKEIILINLLLFFCSFTHANDGPKKLTVSELQAIGQDGKEDVVVNGVTYGIDKDDNQCILQNGSTLSCFAKNSLPYAEKIFSFKRQGMKKDHLVVWFGQPDNRIFGHSAGLYFYDKSDFNSWDRVIGAVNKVIDVTVFNNKLIVLMAEILDSGIDNPTYMLLENNPSTFWESGGWSEIILPFKASHLINVENKLFILGESDGGVHKKFQYYATGKQPLYLHDVSIHEVMINH